MAKTVLVADDEESIRALIAALLNSTDRYRVVMAEDGDQAIEKARAEKPDVVLLDVRMPMKDGYEVCRTLKTDASTSHIRVIMLTAMAQEYDRALAMRSGADAYLPKPFSLKALLDKVQEMLS